MSKVLVLTTVHKLEDPRIFYKQVQSISKFTGILHYAAPSEKKQEFSKERINVIPLPIPQNRFQRFFTSQLQALRIIKKNKYDLIHFHDPELLPLMFFVKLTLRPKIIFDVHENIAKSIKDKTWLPKILRYSFSKIYKVIEEFIIKHFDGIIIAEKSYHKFYGDRAVEILNFPLHLSDSDDTPAKDFDGDLNFVYAGDISEERGIFNVLESFNRILNYHPDFKLDIMGKYASRSVKTAVEQYIEKENIGNSVNIYGFIPIYEVYNFLRNAHIGYSILKPIDNYLESVPTKIFDYMVNGVVVVVTNLPIYKEYVPDVDTGITVDYEEIDKITEKILELVEDRCKLRKMSQNGVYFTKNYFNWNSEEEKLRELYYNILKN